ncbi:MAG: peptidase M24 [Anaerolineaceae bacterium]|nr:peptidase M24 [Anaerolineaceae bacterium]
MRQRNDLVFSMVEYERRLQELRQRMVEQEVEVVISTTPENICYLTGFESPGHYYFNAVVIPLTGEPFAVCRRLEDSGMEVYTWLAERRPYEDTQNPIVQLARALAEFGLEKKRIGIERNCWFFTAVQQEILFTQCPNATFVDCSGIVEAGRLIKSEEEIALIQQVAKTTEAGMKAGIDAVAAGVTEGDVAAEIHYAMIKAGSEWPSIQPFIASGERGAIGHATWTDRVVQTGEPVFLEVSGCLKRYHAPMMRTVFVGEPDDSLWEAEKLVQEAMDACLQTIKPGVTSHAVDAAGRAVIAGSRLGAQQGSRTGYSVGIGLPPDWGEGHILSLVQNETRALQPNMTFHLIPWAQIPGKGGIGFSETVRVTENGCEIITNLERKLFVA